MPDPIDALSHLYATLVDSLDGYRNAIENARGRGLTPVFREMAAFRAKHAVELERHITAPAKGGANSTTVRRTATDAVSMVTGINERILPGLIYGEERVRECYDDAIGASTAASPVFNVLNEQRESLQDKIEDMKRLETHLAASWRILAA